MTPLSLMRFNRIPLQTFGKHTNFISERYQVPVFNCVLDANGRLKVMQAMVPATTSFALLQIDEGMPVLHATKIPCARRT